MEWNVSNFAVLLGLGLRETIATLILISAALEQVVSRERDRI